MKRASSLQRKVRIMATFRCEDCREPFRRRADQPSRCADGKVRCNSCSRSYRSVGRELPTRRTGRTLRCEQCGTEFYRSPSAIAHAERHFCRRACADAWRRDHPRGWVGQVDNSGARNGQYRHGRRVGQNTAGRRKVRDEVARRDGNWCLVCGQPAPGLHLHRVVYGSQGGKYETTNCVQLCGHHHAVIHGNKRRWQPVLLRHLDGDDVRAELVEAK